MSQLTFSYKALDRTGSRTRGRLQAADRSDAYRQVTASGLRPISVRPARSSRLLSRSRKIRLKDVSHFTVQFATLMEARIPIADGIRSIAEQEPNVRFRRVMGDIASKIEAGSSVTEAVAPHRAIFGEVYVSTLQAAEVSGNMIEVLNRLAEMLDNQYETSKNIRSAMMYPLCIVATLTLAVAFLMVFVVPRFAEMFASRGLELPLPTQILIGISTFLRTYWYLVLCGGLGVFFLVRKICRHPAGRKRIDRVLNRIPKLREILTGLAVSRFAHIFGLCLKSGLNLIETLEMAGRASGRPLMQADAEKMRVQVNHGGSLSDVLLSCGYLPGFARRMIAAGEEAAELPKMCSIIARHYNREVAHMTRNIATIIEPVLIVVLATVVLGIALAIFLPMWNMAALI